MYHCFLPSLTPRYINSPSQLLRLHITTTPSDATGLAVGRRPLTAEARVQSQNSAYESGKSATGHYSPNTAGFPFSIIPVMLHAY